MGFVLLWHLWVGLGKQRQKISLLTGVIRFLKRVFPSPFVWDGEEVTPELESPEEEISGWGVFLFRL